MQSTTKRGTRAGQNYRRVEKVGEAYEVVDLRRQHRFGEAVEGVLVERGHPGVPVLAHIVTIRSEPAKGGRRRVLRDPCTFITL